MPHNMIAIINEQLGHLPGVAAAYLFGSHAKGQATSGSDVDVAVYFSPSLVPASEVILDLQEDMAAALHVSSVDVVVLNRANPILAHQVFKHGKCILKNDARAFNGFFVRTLTDYADLKRVRAPIEKALLKGRIYSGR